MSEQLKANQALFLWRMLTAELPEVREPVKSKAKPDLKKDLQPLIERKFISVEKRGRAQYLSLTEKAWAWASEASHVEIMKSRSTVGAEVLEVLLHRLIPFLQRNEIPLASLLSDAPEVVKSSGTELSSDPNTLYQTIERGCLSLASGKRKERVHLAALRKALSSVPRQDLDQALILLQRQGRLVLYREDNTAALTQADHDAALWVGESPRHIVYLEN